ncbi:MAG: hypothetical protein RCG15_08830 [Candidatus Rickettsia vulgarisii]
MIFKKRQCSQQIANLSNLEHGEMIAIYEYTGGEYGNMNDILKGKKLSDNEIPMTLLNIAVASVG